MDDALIKEQMRTTREQTLWEAVDVALRSLLAKHRSRELLALRGADLIDPGYEMRTVRRPMTDDAAGFNGLD